MFTSQHAVFKIADYFDKLDDWLPYAEDLIGKWATQCSDDVKFNGEFELAIAAALLEDDLLPRSARMAFGKVIQKYDWVDQSRPISKKQRGRKAENIGAKREKMRKVRQIISEGATAAAAYKAVAHEYHKSPETIRRDYERFVKDRIERGQKV